MKPIKNLSFQYLPAIFIFLFSAPMLHGQVQVNYIDNTRVVNMIPFNQSGETWQDSEPNIAVDPSNTNRIIGSAFTINPTGATNAAPIFTSTDGGNNWALNNIVPSGNGMTGDITLKFNQNGTRLYTGILRGGSFLRMIVLRSNNPYGAAMMQQLIDHSTVQFDQPYVHVLTTQGPTRDRVFVGFNNFGNRSGAGGTSRTAEIEYSNNAANAAPPAGLTRAVIEPRNTFAQDMPAIRTSANADGTVYAVFYSWTSGNTPNARCDIVVVRDDNFGTGASPFTALVDAGDGNPGNRVIQNRLVPAFPASLGANRLVASNLSIAVDPNDSDVVYIAWADRVGTNDYTLHLRRSRDGGVNWSGDLLTITNATNPALAINFRGVVGFAYQQLTGTSPNQNWETRFRRTFDDGITWQDMELADTPDNNPNPTFQPYIGDYIDLMVVGLDFYGIFSASNIPDNNNFPQGIVYQRNANFTTNQLTDNLGMPVAASIDPFFYSVSESLTITCPPSILEDNDPGICGATISFPAPGPGDVPPGVTLTYNPPSGSIFPVGVTTVDCTAEDLFGNSTTCSFTVTVTDVEAPVITCPADVTVTCDTSPTDTGLATATDNCDPTPGITHSDEIISGVCEWNCEIRRTWTATDDLGHSSTCQQIIEKDVSSLIEEAINKDIDGDGIQDDLVLGITQTTLTIDPASASCVVGWLPYDGTNPTALVRDKGKVGGDCKPGFNPVNTDGKITNPLFGEGLKLALILRLDPAFGNTPLSDFSCTIAPIVLQTVSNTPTLGELMDVTNKALGNRVLVPHLNELLDALVCINGTLDICDFE